MRNTLTTVGLYMPFSLWKGVPCGLEKVVFLSQTAITTECWALVEKGMDAKDGRGQNADAVSPDMFLIQYRVNRSGSLISFLGVHSKIPETEQNV